MDVRITQAAIADTQEESSEGGTNMSWEEMSKKEVKCPCGKGVVTLITEGDDWNRYREKTSIECPKCRKIYEIIEKTHHGLLASDGCWKEYALLRKDYPTSEYAFMKIVDVPMDTPFHVYLIRAYSKKDLVDILEEYQSITRVKDLVGAPKRVAKDSKERTGQAVRENIIVDISKALELYDDDPSNGDKYEESDRIRKAKHEEYLKKREKHLIKLDF